MAAVPHQSLFLIEFSQKPYLAITLFSFLPTTAIAACSAGNVNASGAPVDWSRRLMLVSVAASEIITYRTESASAVGNTENSGRERGLLGEHRGEVQAIDDVR